MNRSMVHFGEVYITFLNLENLQHHRGKLMALKGGELYRWGSSVRRVVYAVVARLLAVAILIIFVRLIINPHYDEVAELALHLV